MKISAKAKLYFLLVSGLAFYYITILCLKTLPIKTIVSFLKVKKAVSLRYLEVDQLEIDWLLRKLGNNCPKFDNCLVSSITLYLLLVGKVEKLALYIGVENTDVFKAHAWLGAEDYIIDYNQTEINFKPIFTL